MRGRFLKSLLIAMLFCLPAFLPVYAHAASVYGYFPGDIKTAYHLPQTGGSGTIAIVDAYDNPNAEKDLNVFSQQFNLPSCTRANGCLIIQYPSGVVPQYDPGWAQEEDIDIEMTHAIAPNAKIELIEVNSENSSDLISGIDYARKQQGVVAVSMSWGSSEYNISNEQSLENLFTGSGISFFASSGDGGYGTAWPSVSANVIAVGGTSLYMNGSSVSETAWSGSGGGLSSGISEPAYQSNYRIPGANGRRGVPDVSMVADPNTGVAFYVEGRWRIAGGTSVGAPIWAGIRALSRTALTPTLLYQNATANYAGFFRDIISGNNGSCSTYCSATTGYDYVTGLGSPIGLQEQSQTTSPPDTPIPTNTPAPTLACIGGCGCNRTCSASPTPTGAPGNPVPTPTPPNGQGIFSCNFWQRFFPGSHCTCTLLSGNFSVCFPVLF